MFIIIIERRPIKQIARRKAKKVTTEKQLYNSLQDQKVMDASIEKVSVPVMRAREAVTVENSRTGWLGLCL